jgi:hypothetical protein
VGSQGLVTSVGQAVLETISALDSGPAVPAATPYLLLDGKVVPGWALSLLSLALIVPVLLTTIDGLARARRRGLEIWRWAALVLATAIPFALAALAVLGARLVGLIAVAPPAPVPAGAIPLHSAGIAVLAIAVAVILGGLLVVRPFALALLGREDSNEGASTALLLVFVLVALAIWIANPFAALLIVPALHLWLLAINFNLRWRFPLRLVLVLAGLAPVALIVIYYSITLGFSPIGAAWSAVLMIAGGAVSPLAVFEWSVVVGCAVSAIGIAAAAAREAHPEQAPITVRGPINYAGPGSLGGTKSALRR